MWCKFQRAWKQTDFVALRLEIPGSYFRFLDGVCIQICCEKIHLTLCRLYMSSSDWVMLAFKLNGFRLRCLRRCLSLEVAALLGTKCSCAFGENICVDVCIFMWHLKVWQLISGIAWYCIWHIICRTFRHLVCNLSNILSGIFSHTLFDIYSDVVPQFWHVSGMFDSLSGSDMSKRTHIHICQNHVIFTYI